MYRTGKSLGEAITQEHVHLRYSTNDSDDQVGKYSKVDGYTGS